MPKYPLTISSYGKGMSSDEFVGGDFLVGNNVDIFNNTQSFKLSKKTSKTVINNRTLGITKDAIYAPTFGDGLIMLSEDGHIENLTSRKTSTTTTGAPTSGNYGAIYQRTNAQLIGYKTVSAGDDIFTVSGNKLDRLAFTSGIESGGVTTTTNLVTNPGITSDTGWTVGSGWTTGANGAEHTAGGGTAALTQSITPSGATGKYRLVVRITNHTAGTVEVKRRGTTYATIGASTTGRLSVMVFDFGGGSAGDLSFVPTSTFNGRVNYVVLYEYTSALKYDEVTLSGDDARCWLLSNGRLYIGNSNFVDIVDTTLSTWVLDNTLELPGDQTVIAITEIGDTLNIYTRDGVNGHKYLWNGVDSFPAEKILRESLKIDSVDSDGNIDKVMCSDGVRTYIYLTSGWDRQLLYTSTYKIFGEDVVPQPYLWEIENRLYTPSVGRGITNGGGFTAITGIDYIYIYGEIYPGVKGGITKFESVGEYPTDTIPFVKFLNGRFYTTYINPSQTGTKDNQIMSWSMLANYATELNQSGYVIYKPTLRDNSSSFKSLDKLKLGYRMESEGNQIDIYARVDDYHYITFYCEGVSVYPSIGSVYSIDAGGLGTITVLAVDETDGTVSGIWEQAVAYRFLNNLPNALPLEIGRVSGTGDDEIDIVDADHFIKIKSIVANDDEFVVMNRSVVLGRDNLDIKLPHRQKLQLKVKIRQGFETDVETTSPEVFDLGVLASIVQDV